MLILNSGRSERPHLSPLGFIFNQTTLGSCSHTKTNTCSYGSVGRTGSLQLATSRTKSRCCGVADTHHLYIDRKCGSDSITREHFDGSSPPGLLARVLYSCCSYLPLRISPASLMHTGLQPVHFPTCPYRSRCPILKAFRWHRIISLLLNRSRSNLSGWCLPNEPLS